MRDRSTLKRLIWLKRTALSGAEAVWQTITGAIVTFTTLRAARVKSLSVDIEPVQSGSGDPAPDNIRPISGWTGTRVTRCGKNIFDDSAADWKTGYFITNAGVESAQSAYKYCQTFIPVKPNTEYAIQIKKNSASSTGLTVPFYDADKNFISRGVAVAATTSTGMLSGTVTTPGTAAYLRISCAYNANPDYNTTNVQIEEGSTATDYEPYTGTTYEVDWTDEAGVAYGGTAVYNGNGTWMLTRTMGFLDLGDFEWNVPPTTATDKAISCRPNNTLPSDLRMKFQGKLVCSAYEGRTDRTYNTIQEVEICATNSQAILILRILDSTFNGQTPDFVKAALTGVKLAYELLTPQIYTITTEELISTLLGQNNIWADTGDVTVEYLAN